MGFRNDYRVSVIVVLCKDCGEDVGLYPARHQCLNNQLPYLPTLCSTTSNWSEAEDNSPVPDLVDSSTTVTRQASDSSMESGKWSFFKSNTSTPAPTTPPVTNNVTSTDDDQETSYFDNYATHLKTSGSLNDMSNSTPTSNGKKLWGRMKENEKWKELLAAEKKKEESKSSGKLWERIIQATMPNAFDNQYHDADPDSDEEDWEGETHVSRILREYHESKYKTLPHWLYDDCRPIKAAPITQSAYVPNDATMYRSKSTRLSGRRLWQTEEDAPPTSARERERQALRATSGGGISRTQSERMAAPPSLISRPQRSSLRNNNSESMDNQMIYGSTAPRRTNTLRNTRRYYLDDNNNNNNNSNIPVSQTATTSRSGNYI